jgi:hypothetical protein
MGRETGYCIGLQSAFLKVVGVLVPITRNWNKARSNGAEKPHVTWERRVKH